jgi:hypothetical protein
MSRLGKQLLFGSLLIAIIGIVVFGLYAAFQPTQSCTNNRRDWGEEGVDCGGRCANACIPSTLRQVTIVEPQFFRNGDTIAVLLRLTNPNSDYAAGAFRYRLQFLEGDTPLRTKEVNTFLYPDEVRYEVEFADITDAERVTEVRADALQVTWASADRFGRPNLSIQDRATGILGSIIQSSGRVVNHEPTDVSDVKVLALYHGRSGLLGVSKTELGSMRGGETKNFTVVHPLIEEFDENRTEYFVFARRASSR